MGRSSLGGSCQEESFYVQDISEIDRWNLEKNVKKSRGINESKTRAVEVGEKLEKRQLNRG